MDHWSSMQHVFVLIHCGWSNSSLSLDHYCFFFCIFFYRLLLWELRIENYVDYLHGTAQSHGLESLEQNAQSAVNNQDNGKRKDEHMQEIEYK